MSYIKYLGVAVSCVFLFVASMSYSQPSPPRNCQLPVEPDLVDGSTAAMEELVATSKAVNAFIEDADKYLDCQNSMSKMANRMPEDMQIQRATNMMVVLNRRNAIGDEFNAEVEKYRQANPE